jgi:dCMP deaminase
MFNMEFVKKYMLTAKLFGELKNPCYSRKIGVVILNANLTKVVGMGYNGPPRGAPHCDTPEHLKNIFLPQLTDEDKNCIAKSKNYESFDEDKFIRDFAYEKVCPRKILGCPSGKRLELCSCVHAETNAIVNASCDLQGAHMFAWCTLPCIECTKLIINSGIKKLFCLKDNEPDYSVGSRFLIKQCNVDLVEMEKDFFKDN